MTPKVFISYSWTSPEHIEWVKTLGQDLLDSGIDVVLDKWDLKEGHDSNAFMERMVTDKGITKVIMVCDRMYAEKADGRKGGAGTEAQIISPALYGKRDQDRFVAVIREKDDDGKAWVPTFFKGRIYIDLLEETSFVEQFERLVRWVFEKPLDVKPALGKPPAYISEENNSVRLATSVSYRRAVDALKNGRGQAAPASSEYLHTVTTELEKLRIPPDAEEFDEKVYASIEAFIPQRNELVDFFVNVARYQATSEMSEIIHRFFEGLIPYMHRPSNVNAWREWDYDNYKFIAVELLYYYVGTMIANEKFDMATHLITTPFYMGAMAENRREPMSDYSEFMQQLRSLEHRDHRLGLNRRHPEAALLSERCKGLPLEFRHLQAADLIMYLRARRDGFHWFPFTISGFRYHSIQIEVFARARAHAYFNRIKGMIGVKDEREFVSFIQTLDAESQRQSTGYGSMRGIADLVGLSAISLNVK